MVEYRKRILVTLDGSDQSFEAVRYVSRLLLPDRIEVVLFHVMSKIPEDLLDIEKNIGFKHKVASLIGWTIQQEKEIREFMEKGRQLLLDRGIPDMSSSLFGSYSPFLSMSRYSTTLRNRTCIPELSKPPPLYLP